jgi:hypothetical protein
MTAFATVGKTDLLRRLIDVYVGEQGPDGYVIRQADGSQLSVRRDEASLEVKPTIQLRENEARALLAELLRHFQGGDDTRQLRKDYEAERARVDTFIAAVVDGRLQ